MSERWSNWAGNETARPAFLHHCRSVEDACAAVAAAAERGQRVRVAGSGHSHYRLVPTDDVIIDLSALTGLIDVDHTDPDAPRATLWAGTTVAQAGPLLAQADVGFVNQGDIDGQTVAGAAATGTHGTGRTLTSFSAAVTAVEFIDATGELQRTGHGNPATLEVARLSLGAIGVVTAVTFAVRPAYRLADTVTTESWHELRPTVTERVEAHRHVEFFWYPPTDQAMVKTIDETDEPARYPIGPEGERLGRSHEVLPSHRSRLHTEMEYSVPFETSLDCLDEIRHLIRSDFPELQWPVEYRTLAADEVWLSTAYRRPTATISVHQGVDLPAQELFSACEAVFRRYEGRPHWGKIHYLDGDELGTIHPHWDRWWAERDRLDPDGVFLNEPLTSWRHTTTLGGR